MATLTDRERRVHLREEADRLKVLRVSYEDPDKNGQYLEATPIDFSASGMGLETLQPLDVGALVSLQTYSREKKALGLGYASARVVWCHKHRNGSYRAGVAFAIS